MREGRKIYKKAKKIIPGGTQLLSKRPEMFMPEQWPAYYKRAKGCEIWDIDGNKYIDTSLMGIGSCILGYADKDVDNAVIKAIRAGSMTTLNCPEEVNLAEELCRLHRWADMARFARSGGEATTIAVRIARAHTKKTVILFCGYHGWHDWYLSANIGDDTSLNGHLLPGLDTAGVPESLKGTAVPFNYNDTEGFLRIIKEYENNVAAVIMEPIRNYYPKMGFLEKIREITAKLGIVLIFDEITSGWRLNIGGANLKFKVYPDIAVFAKGISNGYPMAAVIGRKEVMNSAQKTFISSTYWTERTGPVAALATIKKMKQYKVPLHLIKTGKKIQAGWRNLAKKHALDIKIYGIYPLGHFSFTYNEPLVLKTLFTQRMYEDGFLATTLFYVSYAHKDRHINMYLKAVDASFRFIADALKDGQPAKHLKGPVCDSGFRRLN